MISHLGVYRTELLRRVGGFRTGFEGSQDWDLALRVVEISEPARIRHIPHIPRLREMSKKPLARRGRKDSSRRHDSWRLSDLRGTAGPDRSGSGRDGRASSGPAGERAGAAGPRDELRGCRPGAADRRRYDPDVAPAFRGRRGRWPGRLQVWGSRLPVDPGAAGDAEGVGRRHLAADDPERGSNTKFGVVSESRS